MIAFAVDRRYYLVFILLKLDLFCAGLQEVAMLASRLAFLANDILREIVDLKVVNLLVSAQQLAAQRGAIPDHVFVPRVQEIRSRAEYVWQTSKIEQYPVAIKSIIEGSNFRNMLPKNIAKIIIQGLTEDKSLGMPSTEMSVHLERLIPDPRD